MLAVHTSFYLLIVMPALLRGSLSPFEKIGLREPVTSENMFTSTKVVLWRFSHIFFKDSDYKILFRYLKPGLCMNYSLAESPVKMREDPEVSGEVFNLMVKLFDEWFRLR